MITGLWFAIRHNREDTELHLFPIDSTTSACGNRVRGQDNTRFLCHGAPSGPRGCVCMECWTIYRDDLLKTELAEASSTEEGMA